MNQDKKEAFQHYESLLVSHDSEIVAIAMLNDSELTEDDVSFFCEKHNIPKQTILWEKLKELE